MAQSYLSDSSVRDISVQPFSGFVESGLLRVSRYPISDLEADLVQIARKNGCREAAFDPYQAQRSAENLESQGMTAVAMPQNTSHFHGPIEELRMCIAEGRFTHNGDRLLRWAIGNAVTDSDRQDRVMLCKRDSAEKIDPAVALTMAFARAMHGFGRSDGYLVV
jgi:phage terminase large subunit-like protein